jgi:hypothetical protein
MMQTPMGTTVRPVKGGHLMDGSAVAGLPDAIKDSAFQIAAGCFLAGSVISCPWGTR